MAYNFICLLHLANEHGLEITAHDDSHDLSISHSQPEPPKAKPAKRK